MRLAVGLIGCGHWGRHILRDLRLLGVEVDVVARSEQSVANARQGGARTVVKATSELPRSLDGLLVATPTSTHASVVAEALSFGVPVFVEKPLTLSSESAWRLARGNRDRLFVMEKWRYHGGVECLARMADQGSLGRVIGVRSVRLSWGERYSDSDAVWHLVPHEISIAREILGGIPGARAAAVDRVDGVPVGMHGLMGSSPWFSFEASNRSPVRKREIRVYFDAGVATLYDPYADFVELAVGDGRASDKKMEAQRIGISTEYPLVKELREFTKFLSGEGPAPRSTAEDGARTVHAIERLLELSV